MQMQCAPAFNYARDAHVTTIIDDDSIPVEGDYAPRRTKKKVYEDMLDREWGKHQRQNTQSSEGYSSESELGQDLDAAHDSDPSGTERFGHKKALFESPSLNMDLRYVTHNEAVDRPSDAADSEGLPEIELELLDLSAKGHKGLGVQSTFELQEGQGVTFIFRIVPGSPIPSNVAGSRSATPKVDLATPHGIEPKKDEKAVGVALDKKLALHQKGEKAFASGLTAGIRAGEKTKAAKRPADDPWLTKELVSNLLQVCSWL